MANGTSRRNFLKASALSSLALGSSAAHASMLQNEAGVPGAAQQPSRKPNIVLFCSDQMRSDFVGA